MQLSCIAHLRVWLLADSLTLKVYSINKDSSRTTPDRQPLFERAAEIEPNQNLIQTTGNLAEHVHVLNRYRPLTKRSKFFWWVARRVARFFDRPLSDTKRQKKNWQ